MKKALFFLSIISTAAGQVHGADSNVPRIAVSQSAVALTDWLALGPFSVAPTDSPWENDFFNPIAVSEGQMTTSKAFGQNAARLIAVENAGEPSLSKIRLDRISNAAFIDFNNHFEIPYEPRPPSAVYVACELASTEKREAYLMLGSADGAKIWLNGKSIAVRESKRGVTAYDDAVPLPLEIGNNFLMLKICKWRIPWGMTARLEPSAESAAKTAISMQDYLEGFLLNSSVLAKGDVLIVNPRGAPAGCAFHGKILGRSGEVVEDDINVDAFHPWHPSRPLQPGVYRLILNIEDASISESFIVGEPLEYTRVLAARAVRYSANEKATLNVTALLRRLEILMAAKDAAQTQDSSRRDWERKLVFTVSECETILDSLGRNQETFKDISGLHIRGFHSKIDDQVQHYRIFVPHSYARSAGGSALIVFTPTAFSSVRPFLESPFVAAHSEAERISAIAEQLNVIVVWCGYRAQPVGQPSEFTHIDEVLRTVESDYAIDNRRISLLGACSGGAIATMAAAEWPERFAGIALLNPEFDLPKTVTNEEVAMFRSLPGFKTWRWRTDALEELFKSKGPPILVIHDGAEPGHGDLETSIDFERFGLERNYPVHLNREIQTLGQHFGAWGHLMAWAEKQKRPTPATDNLGEWSTFNEGSVASVFADRFIIVEGTGGTSDDRSAIQRISRELQDKRKKEEFVSCNVVLDKDVNLDAIGDANLVLIGNQATNKLWQDLGKEFPLALARDKVELRGESWSGNNLAIEAMFARRPDGRRKIPFIGSDNLPAMMMPSLNLSNVGWFDHLIWSSESGECKIVSAGKS